MSVTFGAVLAAIATAGLLLIAIKTSSRWTRCWVSLLAVGGLLETYALMDADRGDTFTETTRGLTTHPLAWLALAVGLGWLFYHFVIEKRGQRG